MVQRQICQPQRHNHWLAGRPLGDTDRDSQCAGLVQEIDRVCGTVIDAVYATATSADDTLCSKHRLSVAEWCCAGLGTRRHNKRIQRGRRLFSYQQDRQQVMGFRHLPSQWHVRLRRDSSGDSPSSQRASGVQIQHCDRASLISQATEKW